MTLDQWRGAMLRRAAIFRAASYPQPTSTANSPMVFHREMRSGTDVGMLFMPDQYKTYDDLARANRTPWTVLLRQFVRMTELPKDRLAQARAAAGFSSPTEAARSFPREINQNTIISHENGNRPISRKAAAKYGELFDVPAGWILYGEQASTETGEVDVPLLSMISAGELMRDDIADEALGVVKVSDLPSGDWIALKVIGDSMDRISPPESIILVNRRDKRLVPNRPYVIADEDGNATYKRYRPGPPMRFEPVSTNPKHEPIFPTQEPVIVGRVKRSMIDM